MRRFVAVEGPIGVGKTTLARLLERRRGAEVILEPHGESPFLEPFYREPARYALPLQLSFLLARFEQQERLRQPSLFERWVVADYVWDKDRLFAEKNLTPQDLAAYDQVASRLGDRVPTPDLVVVLDAPVSWLLDRIAERGVPGEERIEAGYLEDLAARYEHLWAGWTRSPILRVDSSQLDYARHPEAQDTMLAMIDRALAGDPMAGATWPGLFDPPRS